MKKVQTALVIGMIFLFTNTFGQSKGLGSEKINNDKATAKTYFDLVLNIVSTNLNYGKSNSGLTDYKKPVLGVQAGVSFQAGITQRFSIVTELYFMMKGGKLNADNPLTTNKTTFRLYTIELPVLARFYLGNFYVNAGPSIAYNLSGTIKVDDLSTHVAFNNSNDAFKRIDAGIQAGGGYMFPLKQKRIALDLRYNYGLSNISNNKEMYNRSFIVSVHFSKAWKTNPFGKNKSSNN